MAAPDKTSAATGAAYGATIQVQNEVGALEAALAVAREAAKSAFYDEQVARLTAKVRRAAAALAGTEDALTDALNERDTEQARLAVFSAGRDRIAALPPDERAAAEKAAADQAEAARLAWRATNAQERAAAKAAQKGN